MGLLEPAQIRRLKAPASADRSRFHLRSSIAVGSMHTYSGFAAYVKINRLEQPPGALFLEYHQVFAEPRGWFDGINLLRSKLPPLVQTVVRSFRRDLKNWSAAK